LITTAVAAKNLIGASTSTSPNFGIVPGHSYSLFNAYTVTNSSGSYKLIQLRNPYGYDNNYLGNWNDTDISDWTASFEQKTNFVNNTSDGFIFIGTTDFLNNFLGI
jgi:hypothetical protein